MAKCSDRSLASAPCAQSPLVAPVDGRRAYLPLAAALLSLLAAACGGTVDGAAAGSASGGRGGGGAPRGSGGASPASGGATQEPGGTGGATAAASGGATATSTGGTRVGTGGATATSTGGARAGTGGLSATGGRSVSGGGGGSTSVSASDPVLPAISGTCPTFTTGTATIGGLAGISLQVGAKSQGTGTLLFYWHGTGSSAGEVNALVPAAVRQEILGQGGIIVSFQSTLGSGGDCSGTGTFSKDDFGIADLIAACAVRDQGIDPHRIYTTGCSAGGLQAGCMGALRSSYIAATVPNSGGEVTRLPLQDAKHVPAVMTMHGGSSDMVVVSFSMTSATYDTQMKGAGSFVVNCNHGGGHCQAPAALYTAGWEFMKAHPFGVAPEPYTAALPATFPTYCAKF